MARTLHFAADCKQLVMCICAWFFVSSTISRETNFRHLTFLIDKIALLLSDTLRKFLVAGPSLYCHVVGMDVGHENLTQVGNGRLDLVFTSQARLDLCQQASPVYHVRWP